MADQERCPVGGHFVAAISCEDFGCFDQEPDPPTCNICDAVGHGYPGAGPCPLEVGQYDPREEAEMALHDQVWAEGMGHTHEERLSW